MSATFLGNVTSIKQLDTPHSYNNIIFISFLIILAFLLMFSLALHEPFFNPFTVRHFFRYSLHSLTHFSNDPFIYHQAHTGIHGFVKSSKGKPIANAIIRIADRRHDVISYKDGDYWRLLVPGSYDVTASAKGFEPQTKVVVLKGGEIEKYVNFSLRSSDELKPNFGSNNDFVSRVLVSIRSWSSWLYMKLVFDKLVMLVKVTLVVCDK